MFLFLQLVDTKCLAPPFIDAVSGDVSCHSGQGKQGEYLQAKNALLAELVKRYAYMQNDQYLSLVFFFFFSMLKLVTGHAVRLHVLFNQYLLVAVTLYKSS